MNKKILIITMLILSALVCSACGISAKGLKNDPGYAAFHYPSFWQADKEISLSLGPTILRIARSFVTEDEEVSAILRNVKGIHLRVYSVDENFDVVNDYVEDSAQNLDARGWDRIVTARQDDNYVVVMVKMEVDEIQGMVVLLADHEEAAYINVIGNIPPEALRPLIAQVYEDAPAINTL